MAVPRWLMAVLMMLAEAWSARRDARLKGPGMRWDKDNAEALMALAGIYHSRLWQNYCQAQRQAA